MTPSERFSEELEVFRHEVQGGTQLLFAHLAVSAIASKSKQTRAALNRSSLFWNTALAGLQQSGFITLGRIFDQSSQHNVNSVLRLAQNGISIFSKESLADRKRQGSANADEWLEDYLRTAYVPTARDFRALRRLVTEQRGIYERSYRDIRHHFAHTNIHHPEDVGRLFSKTQIRELERLYVFLNRLHEALWQLFQNGRKPVLPRMRYSIRSMLSRSYPRKSGKPIHAVIVEQTTACMKLLRHGHKAAIRSSQPR